MTDHESEAKDFLLRTLLEEVRSHGKTLAHIDQRQDQILESNQLLTEKFVRLVRRQREDRERNERRFNRIEKTLFPMNDAPMRPPAPSGGDSEIHDLQELQKGLAQIKPHVEREMRHDSWWYKQRWGLVSSVSSGGIVALIAALITYLITRGH